MIPSGTPAKHEGTRHGWWQLLILTAVLYLPGTATIPLMDRDEPRFAHATAEMMQRGTWTIPYFNGEYRFDKPPLTYWWMRLHYHLFGVNELAARLHGVVAVYLTALAIAGFATRLSQCKRAGQFAGLAWLVTLQVMVHGRLCVADMPMVLLVTLSCRSLAELLMTESEPRRWGGWFWSLWLSLGAGFLAKGPIAWLVPGLTVVLWRWVFWRRPVPWQRLQALAGFGLTFAMVAGWGIPALIETKGAFWDTGMGEHVVKRGMDVFNGRRFVPGYYLLTTWLSLFPWLGFAVPVWRGLRSCWNAPRAFLAAWFVAPQVIFFFYATQLPHYVMPGYPAFLVLLALAWNDRQKSGNDAVPALARWLTIGLGGLAVGAWVWIHTLNVIHPEIRGLLDHALATLFIVLGLGGCAACLVWKDGCRGRSVWFAGAVALVAAWSLNSLGENLRSCSIPLSVAEKLQTSSKDTVLTGCGYTEPSLVFYTDRIWRFSNDLSLLTQHLGSDPHPVAVVVLRREWTLDRWFKRLLGRSPPPDVATDWSVQIEQALGRVSGVRHMDIEGFNVARFSWVEAVLLVRP